MNQSSKGHTNMQDLYNIFFTLVYFDVMLYVVCIWVLLPPGWIIIGV